jgi:predicted AAA+ superfamily ATPase
MVNRKGERSTIAELLTRYPVYVIHAGEETYRLNPKIEAIPLSRLLSDLKPL